MNRIETKNTRFISLKNEREIKKNNEKTDLLTKYCSKTKERKRHFVFN